MTKLYRLKYDHRVDGGYSKIENTKKQAIKRIRKDLKRFPYIKIALQASKKSGVGWKHAGTYMYRYNRKTKRHRVVKI